MHQFQSEYNILDQMMQNRSCTVSLPQLGKSLPSSGDMKSRPRFLTNYIGFNNHIATTNLIDAILCEYQIVCCSATRGPQRGD